MSGKGKRYDGNFQKMIVKLNYSGSSVSDHGRENGLTGVSIYRKVVGYSFSKTMETG